MEGMAATDKKTGQTKGMATFSCEERLAEFADVVERMEETFQRATEVILAWLQVQRATECEKEEPCFSAEEEKELGRKVDECERMEVGVSGDLKEAESRGREVQADRSETCGLKEVESCEKTADRSEETCDLKENADSSEKTGNWKGNADRSEETSDLNENADSSEKTCNWKGNADRSEETHDLKENGDTWAKKIGDKDGNDSCQIFYDMATKGLILTSYKGIKGKKKKGSERETVTRGNATAYLKENKVNSYLRKLGKSNGFIT